MNAARQLYLEHDDVSTQVRQAVEGMNARIVRLRRQLGTASTTPAARTSAKDELKKLITEAVALQEII